MTVGGERGGGGGGEPPPPPPLSRGAPSLFSALPSDGSEAREEQGGAGEQGGGGGGEQGGEGEGGGGGVSYASSCSAPCRESPPLPLPQRVGFSQEGKVLLPGGLILSLAFPPHPPHLSSSSSSSSAPPVPQASQSPSFPPPPAPSPHPSSLHPLHPFGHLQPPPTRFHPSSYFPVQPFPPPPPPPPPRPSSLQDPSAASSSLLPSSTLHHTLPPSSSSSLSLPSSAAFPRPSLESSSSSGSPQPPSPSSSPSASSSSSSSSSCYFAHPPHRDHPSPCVLPPPSCLPSPSLSSSPFSPSPLASSLCPPGASFPSASPPPPLLLLPASSEAVGGEGRGGEGGREFATTISAGPPSFTSPVGGTSPLHGTGESTPSGLQTSSLLYAPHLHFPPSLPPFPPCPPSLPQPHHPPSLASASTAHLQPTIGPRRRGGEGGRDTSTCPVALGRSGLLASEGGDSHRAPSCISPRGARSPLFASTGEELQESLPLLLPSSSSQSFLLLPPSSRQFALYELASDTAASARYSSSSSSSSSYSRHHPPRPRDSFSSSSSSSSGGEDSASSSCSSPLPDHQPPPCHVVPSDGGLPQQSRSSPGSSSSPPSSPPLRSFSLSGTHPRPSRPPSLPLQEHEEEEETLFTSREEEEEDEAEEGGGSDGFLAHSLPPCNLVGHAAVSFSLTRLHGRRGGARENALQRRRGRGEGERRSRGGRRTQGGFTRREEMSAGSDSPRHHCQDVPFSHPPPSSYPPPRQEGKPREGSSRSSPPPRLFPWDERRETSSSSSVVAEGVKVLRRVFLVGGGQLPSEALEKAARQIRAGRGSGEVYVQLIHDYAGSVSLSPDVYVGYAPIDAANSTKEAYHSLLYEGKGGGEEEGKASRKGYDAYYPSSSCCSPSDDSVSGQVFSFRSSSSSSVAEVSPTSSLARLSGLLRRDYLRFTRLSPHEWVWRRLSPFLTSADPLRASPPPPPPRTSLRQKEAWKGRRPPCSRTVEHEEEKRKHNVSHEEDSTEEEEEDEDLREEAESKTRVGDQGPRPRGEREEEEGRRLSSASLSSSCSSRRRAREKWALLKKREQAADEGREEGEGGREREEEEEKEEEEEVGREQEDEEEEEQRRKKRRKKGGFRSGSRVGARRKRRRRRGLTLMMTSRERGRWDSRVSERFFHACAAVTSRRREGGAIALFGGRDRSGGMADNELYLLDVSAFLPHYLPPSCLLLPERDEDSALHGEHRLLVSPRSGCNVTVETDLHVSSSSSISSSPPLPRGEANASSSSPSCEKESSLSSLRRSLFRSLSSSFSSDSAEEEATAPLFPFLSSSPSFFPAAFEEGCADEEFSASSSLSSRQKPLADNSLLLPSPRRPLSSSRRPPRHHSNEASRVSEESKREEEGEDGHARRADGESSFSSSSCRAGTQEERRKGRSRRHFGWAKFPVVAERPCARWGHSLVYAEPHLILFGGLDACGRLLNDTWILNLFPSASPSPSSASRPSRPVPLVHPPSLRRSEDSETKKRDLHQSSHRSASLLLTDSTSYSRGTHSDRGGALVSAPRPSASASHPSASTSDPSASPSSSSSSWESLGAVAGHWIRINFSPRPGRQDSFLRASPLLQPLPRAFHSATLFPCSSGEEKSMIVFGGGGECQGEGVAEGSELLLSPHDAGAGGGGRTRTLQESAAELQEKDFYSPVYMIVAGGFVRCFFPRSRLYVLRSDRRRQQWTWAVAPVRVKNSADQRFLHGAVRVGSALFLLGGLRADDCGGSCVAGGGGGAPPPPLVTYSCLSRRSLAFPHVLVASSPSSSSSSSSSEVNPRFFQPQLPPGIFGAQPWEMAGEIFAVGGLRVGMRGKKDKLSSCLPSSSSSLRASKAFRHEGGSADVFFSSSSAGGVSLLERDEGEESSGWLAGDGGGGLEGRTEGGEEGRLRSFGLLRIDACDYLSSHEAEIQRLGRLPLLRLPTTCAPCNEPDAGEDDVQTLPVDLSTSTESREEEEEEEEEGGEEEEEWGSPPGREGTPAVEGEPPSPSPSFPQHFPWSSSSTASEGSVGCTPTDTPHECRTPSRSSCASDSPGKADGCRPEDADKRRRRRRGRIQGDEERKEKRVCGSEDALKKLSEGGEARMSEASATRSAAAEEVPGSRHGAEEDRGRERRRSLGDKFFSSSSSASSAASSSCPAASDALDDGRRGGESEKAAEVSGAAVKEEEEEEEEGTAGRSRPGGVGTGVCKNGGRDMEDEGREQEEEVPSSGEKSVRRASSQIETHQHGDSYTFASRDTRGASGPLGAKKGRSSSPSPPSSPIETETESSHQLAEGRNSRQGPPSSGVWTPRGEATPCSPRLLQRSLPSISSPPSSSGSSSFLSSARRNGERKSEEGEESRSVHSGRLVLPSSSYGASSSTCLSASPVISPSLSGPATTATAVAEPSSFSSSSPPQTERSPTLAQAGPAPPGQVFPSSDPASKPQFSTLESPASLRSSSSSPTQREKVRAASPPPPLRKSSSPALASSPSPSANSCSSSWGRAGERGGGGGDRGSFSSALSRSAALSGSGSLSSCVLTSAGAAVVTSASGLTVLIPPRPPRPRRAAAQQALESFRSLPDRPVRSSVSPQEHPPPLDSSPVSVPATTTPTAGTSTTTAQSPTAENLSKEAGETEEEEERRRLREATGRHLSMQGAMENKETLGSLYIEQGGKSMEGSSSSRSQQRSVDHGPSVFFSSSASSPQTPEAFQPSEQFLVPTREVERGLQQEEALQLRSQRQGERGGEEEEEDEGFCNQSRCSSEQSGGREEGTLGEAQSPQRRRADPSVTAKEETGDENSSVGCPRRSWRSGRSSKEQGDVALRPTTRETSKNRRESGGGRAGENDTEEGSADNCDDKNDGGLKQATKKARLCSSLPEKGRD